jgi:hypothetical protein
MQYSKFFSAKHTVKLPLEKSKYVFLYQQLMLGSKKTYTLNDRR